MSEVMDIIQLKHRVLYLTAKYAFEGRLEEKYDAIPYDIIPGKTPQFRCCVYREREIVRERVRLAMGKLPSGESAADTSKSQIVHVIQSACEGCPISRITVTQNCRGCLAKKCVKACAFGAITWTTNGSIIDKSKCKNCGKCVEACPYNAIVDIERPCKQSCSVGAIQMDQDDIAVIDESKCVNCGACVVGCPFGAISDKSVMTGVIDSLLHRGEGKKVYAMVAPAIEGQFGDANLASIKNAIRKLGFDEVYEVALGADIVAYHEAQELMERVEDGQKMTSSCCPAFVSLVRKHYPMLEDKVSTTVSPMVAIERYIKSKEPDCTVVFIGPCIAKKNEVLSQYEEEIEYALTFEELAAMLEACEISVEECDDFEDQATKFGKGFAMSGGVTQAVIEVLAEKGNKQPISTIKCTGPDECKKTLTLFKVGRLKEDFVEGMYCYGGCIAGPATLAELNKSKRIFEKYKNENMKVNVSDNFNEKGLGAANPHRAR